MILRFIHRAVPAFLCLAALSSLRAESDAIEPIAVPTFHCVGLYWKPESGAMDNPCLVQYRVAGAPEWKDAMPLWFDPTDHPGNPTHSREYRGSIVNLEPDTSYEIRLRLGKDGAEKTLSTSTWKERFPVKKTVLLPADSPQPIQITEGGDDGGYVVYAAAPGAVFDGKGEADSNIVVNASRVILRGLTLRNAKIHGIQLGDVQDVVVEGCDISGWGRIAEDGFGMNLDSAIFSRSRKLTRIVVQDNLLHHPRSNANSWLEERKKKDGGTSKHPLGPQGITFSGSPGHLVIRRNKIFSDIDHMFNDGMGETKNFSYGGFPNRDSDIYENEISHAFDDGIEAEGADMNVRVWSNRFDHVFGAVGAATSSLGPLYVFRNVMHSSRMGRKEDAESNKGSYLVKLGNEDPQWGKGKIFIFHNTMIQTPPRFGLAETTGGSVGIICTSDKKFQCNLTTRNNVIFLRSPQRPAIRDAFRDPSNDFDYDLYNGILKTAEGQEKHGIAGEPRFDTTVAGRYPLQAGSPGFDAGERLPNFNDAYSGAAPDMGAFEAP